MQRRPKPDLRVLIEDDTRYFDPRTLNELGVLRTRVVWLTDHSHSVRVFGAATARELRFVRREIELHQHNTHALTHAEHALSPHDRDREHCLPSATRDATPITLEPELLHEYRDGFIEHENLMLEAIDTLRDEPERYRAALATPASTTLAPNSAPPNPHP